MNTQTQTKIKCIRDGQEWGSYVRAGETYEADKGRIDWRLAANGSSTYITRSLFKLATDKGWLVEVAA